MASLEEAKCVAGECWPQWVDRPTDSFHRPLFQREQEDIGVSKYRLISLFRDYDVLGLYEQAK